MRTMTLALLAAMSSGVGFDAPPLRIPRPRPLAMWIPSAGRQAKRRRKPTAKHRARKAARRARA